MGQLKGRVAVVTGASRGAGKGIALALGAAGATVYVTGRSTRNTVRADHPDWGAWPGTIDETAEAVTEQGGIGIPVRCDHTADTDVEALFVRVKEEQGRLDVLVNNAWGGHDGGAITPRPFWELSLDNWQHMFTGGVRAGIVSSYYALPLMLRQGHGLIINIGFWDHDKYTGSFWYDLAKNACNRVAFGLAHDVRDHGIAAVALSPGWMRTELVLAHFGTDDAHWVEHEALHQTESVTYVGRAVVALASDPDVLEKSGRALRVGDLAREYGFTDVDGRQPPPFELGGGAT